MSPRTRVVGVCLPLLVVCVMCPQVGAIVPFLAIPLYNS